MGVGSWFGQRFPSFAWGTLVVNVSGSFVLGLLFALLIERAAGSTTMRLALTTGLLGAYTTFSLETMRMFEEGHRFGFREHRAQPRARTRGGLARNHARTGARMKIEGEGQLVRVFIGENDTWHGKPLFEAIVLRAREEGLAGATVTRGIEGYGASSRMHTTRLLELSSDLPVVIELVDLHERIARFLPILDEMVTDGLVTTEPVHVLTYRGSSSED